MSKKTVIRQFPANRSRGSHFETTFHFHVISTWNPRDVFVGLLSPATEF